MRIRRWTTAGLAALTAVPAILVATAVTSPAHAATGPYSGSAAGDLVHVNALNAPPITPGLADVHLARSTADVNSAGLGNPYSGKRSAARGTNLDAPLLGNAIDLNPILTTATQTAPPTNNAPVVESLTGPIDLAPVLSLEAATATAQARWGATDATCVAPGTPISYAKSAVADAGLLGPLPLPTGEALVSVVNNNGGAAYTESTVGLTDVAGQANKGLKSTVLDQVDGVVLFKGSNNELTLNVVAPPTVTAIATGKASTSTVSYNQPVVQIVQGGDVIDVLNASDLNAHITIPGVILDLELGTLESVVKTDTKASGEAVLLSLTVLDVTGTLTLAKAEIAPMQVSATVPVGGVTCSNPLSNTQVDASTPTVLPNGSFEYAVTVPNIGECTVKDVKVVLNVAGPAGTKITGTAPTANTVTDTSATWNNIGDIAPGALKVVKATVKVPANAPIGATFTGTATASGTCDGSPVSATATSGPVPSVGTPSETGCDISASSIQSSHKEVRKGDFFNEYVRLSNLGKNTCSSIKVTVPYPPNTTFVTCTDACTHDDKKRVVTWTVKNLASGTSKDLVATFKVNADAPNGANLGTMVTITSGKQVVTDKTTLPVVTSSNVLNNGAQRSRGLLPRTGADAPLGLAFALMGAFLGLRALRRRGGLA